MSSSNLTMVASASGGNDTKRRSGANSMSMSNSTSGGGGVMKVEDDRNEIDPQMKSSRVGESSSSSSFFSRITTMVMSYQPREDIPWELLTDDHLTSLNEKELTTGNEGIEKEGEAPIVNVNVHGKKKQVRTRQKTGDESQEAINDADGAKTTTATTATTDGGDLRLEHPGSGVWAPSDSGRGVNPVNIVNPGAGGAAVASSPGNPQQQNIPGRSSSTKNLSAAAAGEEVEGTQEQQLNGEPNEGAEPEAANSPRDFSAVVKEELVRFIFSDNVTLAPFAVYFFTVIYALLVDQRWETWVIWSFQNCVGLADILIHARGCPSSPRVAKIREALQFIFILCSSFRSDGVPAFANCDNKDYFSTNYLPDSVLPEKTPHRVWHECSMSINMFNLDPPVLIPLAFNLRPWLLATAYIITGLWNLCLAWLYFPARLESYGTIGEASRYYRPPIFHAITTLLIVPAMVTGFVLVYQRRKFLERDFRLQLQNYIRARIGQRLEKDHQMMLMAMLPPDATARVLQGKEVKDFTPSASVLFSDMESFTAWSSTRSAAEVSCMLNEIVVRLDRLSILNKIEKVKTIGDAYWAVAGLPEKMSDHARKMCDFGLSMHECIDAARASNSEWGDIRWRIAVSTGPVYGGVLGTLRLSYEVYGETSDVAVAAEGQGVPGRVVVTESTLHAAKLSHLLALEKTQRRVLEWNGQTIPLFVLPEELRDHRDLLTPRNLFAAAGSSHATTATIDVVSIAASGRRSPTSRSTTGLVGGGLSAVGGPLSVSFAGGLGHYEDDEVEEMILLSTPKLRHKNSLAFSTDGRNSTIDGGRLGEMLLNRSSSHHLGVSSSESSLPQSNNNNVPLQEGSDNNRAENRAKEEEQKERGLSSSNHSRCPTSTATEELAKSSELVLDGDEATTFSASSLAKYQQRKYKYFLLELADPKAEAEYLQFNATTRHRLLLISQVASLGMSISFPVLMLMENENSPLLLILVLLFAVGLHAVDLALHNRIIFSQRNSGGGRRMMVYVHLVLAHFALMLQVIVCLAAPLGTSILTNDSNWLQSINAAVVGFGASTLTSSFAICMINAVVISPLIVFDTLQTVTVQELGNHFLLVLLYLYFVFYMQEKRTRHVFFEAKVAENLEEEQRLVNLEHEALLERIVPSHAIPPLMRWFRNGMRGEDAIADNYDQVLVCFLKMSPPSLASSTSPLAAADSFIKSSDRNSDGQGATKVLKRRAPSLTDAPSSTAATPVATDGGDRVMLFNSELSGTVTQKSQAASSATTILDSALLGHNASGDTNRSSGIYVEGPEGAGESTGSMIAPTSPKIAAGAADQNGGAKKMEWLGPAHVIIDSIVSQYHEIDKIKTIGEIVMFAGPFVGGEDVNMEAATNRLLELVFRIKAELDPASGDTPSPARQYASDIRVGIHTGEIVAAVLGRSKLCFDVFGDNVNIASRAMSSYLTTKEGGGPNSSGVVITEEALKHLMPPASSELEENNRTRADDRNEEEGEDHRNVHQSPDLDVVLLETEDEEEKPLVHRSSDPSCSEGRQQWNRHPHYQFGDVVSVPAKGKGTINLHTVSKVMGGK